MLHMGHVRLNCQEFVMNLVSHTMGDGISPSAWSRGICKRENPTQGAPARAQCPTPAAKSDTSGAHSEQNAQVS